MARMKSELEKLHDLERQKRTYANLTCATRRDEAEAFRRWCEARGMSVRGALLEYIRRCIREDGGAGS